MWYLVKSLKRKTKNHNSKFKTFFVLFVVGIEFIRPESFR